MLEEERKTLEAKFREDLAWYEREWEACREALEEERRAWAEQRRAFLKEISECSKANLALKAELARAEEERRRLQNALKRLQVLERPALGRHFLEAFREDLRLWDERLLQEAEALKNTGLEDFLQKLLEDRLTALARYRQGEEVDFKALRTALVLEWALWAWLEAGWERLGTTP
ncbi:hypothetical protein Thermus77420_16350 [Thermus thalpophilus]